MFPAMRRVAASAVILACSAGCGAARGGGGAGRVDARTDAGGDDAPVCCAPDGAAWLDVGRGGTSFEPLPADAVVQLVLGDQGFWMALLALRGGGFEPAGARVFVQAYLDGERVALLNSEVDFETVAGAFETAGLALVLGGAEAQLMAGRRLDLAVRLTDAAVLTVEATAAIVPAMPAM